MVKRTVVTLGLIGLLTVGQSGAMQNTNPDTVARIAQIIQTYEFQENTPEIKDIIKDIILYDLQGVMATDMEIAQAFDKVQSQGKQMPKEQKKSGKLGRELTASEKENAYKMWLMKQALEKGEKEGTLPEVPKDVQGVIGQTLNQLPANPVLDGELQYKGYPFKIRDLVKKDGSIDLSNPVFGDASEYLLITTDPEQFFRVVEGSYMVVILIAPKFLIEEKIATSASPFAPIMAKWNKEQGPIGIFYRRERWPITWYDYLTSADLLTISKANLYENWTAKQKYRHGPKDFTLDSPFRSEHYGHAKKIMFIFNKR